MNKLKTFLTKLIKNQYFPFLILAILLLIFHSLIHVSIGDDATTFYNALDGTDLISWLVMRYNTWSSRSIIEIFIVLFVRVPFLWGIFDTAFAVLGAYSLSKLFNKNNSPIFNWISSALIICLPFKLYYSAGFIATTIDYFWVAYLGLYSFVVLKKLLVQEKVRWFEYPLTILAMLFASNQEQMCAILLASYLAFGIYYLITTKKFHWFFAVAITINIASIIYIFLCPGNSLRTPEEIEKWFPNFNELSILTKLNIGFMSTMYEYIMQPNIIFIIFALLLAAAVFMKKRGFAYNAVALLPLICALFFGIFATYLGTYFSSISDLSSAFAPPTDLHNPNTDVYTNISWGNPATFVPIIICLLVWVSIFVSLYLIFDEKKYFWLTSFVLLLGLGSRMIMSFSPTIWASSIRTFMFMYFAFIVVSLIIYQQNAKEKGYAFINYLIVAMTLISYFNMLYFTV